MVTRAPAQEPVISDFQPRVGTPGDTLLVEGSGFSVGYIRVYFPPSVLGAVTIKSDTLLEVVVPSGAANGALGIQRNSGSVVYTAATFTRIGNGPFITDVSPAYGSPNDLVTISGLHLAGVAPNGVKFNGVASSDANPAADGTSISVHVPAGAKTGPLSVTTTMGTSNAPMSFTVLGPGPYVTGFSPNFGSPGNHVFIDGVHFSSTTNVQFNGVSASFDIRSETLLEAVAPPGVSTGPIKVSSALGSSTSTGYFFVQPFITNFAPVAARAGTNLSIFGLNLRGASQVIIGGISASFSVASNNRIDAVVPTAATSGVLRVVMPVAYSALSTNVLKIMPTLYSFWPPTGGVGTQVVLTGANLNASNRVVRFNGVAAAAPGNVTFSQLTVTVPSGATTGPISIETVDGGDTNLNNFYLPAAITTFSPTNGPPGTQVLIQGVNFLEASQVSFDAAPAVFIVNSNSSIWAAVPSGVKTGSLRVTTPAGTAVSSGLFYGPPSITRFTPERGLPGTNVTIFGTNLLGTRKVWFNGLEASIASVSNLQVIAVVPSEIQTGPIMLEAPGGSATSSSNFVADNKSNLEIWMTNSPASVTVGSNLSFSITVVNRGPSSASNAIWTNFFPASFVVDSALIEAPWVLSNEGGTWRATCSDFFSGDSSTLLVSGRPQSPGILINTSAIYSDLDDPLPQNNTIASITRVVPLAVLTINWLTNEVKVSWPAALSDYHLEANPEARATGWTAVTNATQSAGDQSFITDTNAGAGKFYRLKK